MKKQEYMQPMIEVVEIDMKLQMLAGSLTSVTSTGLDDEGITLPTDEELTGLILDGAW